MSKIRVLDDSTINQIAAGEVVERPYSVVKELVENAIDAFSTSITIEIRSGGKSLIRVTDNGIGIEPAEIKSAFLRHSTSKINKVEDLQNIMTLGFRGEALASIASVSQVDMVSKTRTSELGRRLVIYAGDIREDSKVGTSNGTTIIVKNIFYNIPVRKKFLKSDLSESTAISDLIYRLAMSNPGISFKYIKDGVTTLKTPGSDLLEDTLYSLLGKEYIDSTILLKKNLSKDGISLEGRVSRATYSRGNRSRQYIFVNGRSVKSKIISKCIEKVYTGIIPQNRFPVFSIFIDIDPKYIDINIHPAKTEIRFLKEADLLDFIEKTVRESLSSETQVLTMDIGSKEDSDSGARASRGPLQSSGRTKLLDPKHLYSKKSSLGESPKEFKSKSPKKPGSNPVQVQVDMETISSHQDLAQAVAELSEVFESDKGTDNIGDKACMTSKLPKLILRGKVFSNYLLAENSLGKELFIIDQHAAHERIMYESLKRELCQEKICTQEIFSPEPLELLLGEFEKFKEYEELFSKLGFILEEFGQNTILIRGLPMVVGKPSSRGFFLEILDSLDDRISENYQLRLDKLMKLACSLSIKSGDRTDDLEDRHLIDQLSQCDNPYTCPHGRPTVMKLSKAEIEKKFKRV